MEMGMPITDTEYYNLTMAKMPEVKKGSEYTIKKGDSLWAIAKSQLGSNAKRSDILDYTYRIAKLNNYDSIKKMNSIKVNDKILLPEVEKAQKTATVTNTQPKQNRTTQQTQSKPAEQAVVTQPASYSQNKQLSQIAPWDNSWQYQSGWSYNQPLNIPFETEDRRARQTKKTTPSVIRPARTTAPVQTQTAKIQEKPKSNAQQGFEDIKNKITGTPVENLTVSSCEAIYSDIHTVYRIDPKNTYIREQIATFIMDKKHNLVNISFNGRKNEMDIRYDYTAEMNGKVKQSDEFGIETKVVDKVDKKEMQQLGKVLKQVVENAKRTYE